MGEKLSWEGIELIWVVLGLLGAFLGISRMPPMTKGQIISAYISGIFFSTQAPLWLDWAYVRWTPLWMNPEHAHLPAFMNNGFAFFFGIGGLFIVPGFIVFWQAFGKDPWSAVARVVNVLRGKSTPTLPDDSAETKP